MNVSVAVVFTFKYKREPIVNSADGVIVIEALPVNVVNVDTTVTELIAVNDVAPVAANTNEVSTAPQEI